MTLDMTFEHRMEVTRREALEEGYNKGQEEGREEGREEERTNCIKNMLRSGITPEKIEEICGYTLQEILDIKSNL